jgi:TrmH family RNA methyltransferase
MKSSKAITSRANPEIKTLRDVRDGKNDDLIFCEGQKVVKDLLLSSLETVSVYATPATEGEARQWLSQARKSNVPVAVLAPAVMNSVSDMTTPPGLIALAKRPAAQAGTFHPNTLALVFDGVQLPQNMGALLRTAEAAGVTDVLVSKNSCDPYNPKAIRGSTGSVFRLNIQTGVATAAILSDLRAHKINTAAAHQNGKTTYTKLDWTRPTALVVGSEGRGFSDQVLREIDATVNIPMKGKTESLNVGVAAAICLFEAVRQRSEREAR